MKSNIPHPRIVIVGAGFAGLRAARLLSHAHVDVLILDYNNYHTFLPLLYQVAAAELEPEDIVYPVRTTLRNRHHLRLFLGTMTGLDMEKKVVIAGERVFPYEYLILSMGSEPHFYGVEGAAENTFQLKNLEHAIQIRNHILTRFEHALYEPDLQKRLKILTFAVIGGGPTGIEFIGAFAELIRGPLKKDYPRLNIKEVRLLLLEATDHLLPGLPEKLQVYTQKRLQKMGVEVWLKAPVSRITPGSVELKDGTVLPLETAIWTAGVRGALPPHVEGLPVLRNAQVKVQPTLQVEDHPEIYVCGDLARFEENGRPLPMERIKYSYGNMCSPAITTFFSISSPVMVPRKSRR